MCIRDSCDGGIDGIGTIVDNKLTLIKKESEDEDSCILTATFMDNDATISEEGCSQHHGALCSFTGTLTKKN